ncbi:MAG TPA: GNAT family N-acetyltransferase [Candidatus Nitrosopolaris sp.]|nr:GNAT family N-acetyltransferase [Candidatus Nitrosopolaris sp.]
MDIAIAPVTSVEIPILLELIHELARYEHLEHEVQATVESLGGSLLGHQAVAGALLGRCDGQVAGYAIYFFTFSSFVGRAGLWLEDVYVRPQFRQRGLGRRLMETVARIGAERNCGRFEWTVLNWNERALEFYQSLGARAMNEWVLFRMTSTNLRRLGSVTGGKEPLVF